jgi:hypothetical protein
MQAEDVRFHVAFDGAQLDAAHDTHAEPGADGFRFCQTVERIMVSERNRAQADALRFADDVARRTRAVGRRRVHVQVDESFTDRGNVGGRHFA